MQLRRSTVVTLAIAGALGGAVAMAPPDGLAGSGQASSTDWTHPSVKPRVGRRHTTFEVTFTLAQAPGRAGYVNTQHREVVSPPAHAARGVAPGWGCGERVVFAAAAARACRPRGHVRVLRGIDNTEIVHAVHERPAPMIPAANGLRLPR